MDIGPGPCADRYCEWCRRAMEEDGTPNSQLPRLQPDQCATLDCCRECLLKYGRAFELVKFH